MTVDQPANNLPDPSSAPAAPSPAEGQPQPLESSEPGTPPVEPRRRILIGSQRDPAAYRPRRRDWIPIEDSEAQASSEGPEAGRPSGEGPPGKRPRRRHRRRKPATAFAAPLPETASSEAGPIAATEPAVLPPVQTATALPETLAGTGGSLAGVQGSGFRVQGPPETSAAPGGGLPLPARSAGGEPPPQQPQSPVELPPLPEGIPEFESVPELESPSFPRSSVGTRTESVPELESAPELLGAVMDAPTPAPGERLSRPSRRQRLSPEQEKELEDALDGAVLDDLLAEGAALADQPALEPDSRHTGRVIAIRRDDVFIELGGREQGSIPLRQFAEPPPVGETLEVAVQRFNTEDGLYELAIPGTAVAVDDWGDLKEGMLVEARVTGHNTGGLECEVNHLRAFIPASQVALYRVEDMAQFVGQSLTCLVTEANPERRNLVLSRRALLEREREEARVQRLAALQPGQVVEGVVRRLMDFGAFVDLGGVDGLLHVSQLAWYRVGHPSEVLSEGQRIQVRIEKVDPTTGKISLAYRELLQNPWTQAAVKYPPQGVFRGKVTRLMEFGAFVELEPGVEGLIHISELAHKRVWRTSDVVKEGDEVEVLVLAVDTQAQRISLSIKALSAPPKPKKDRAEEPQPEPQALPAPPKRQKPEPPLLGGLGRPAGGKPRGLKW